jgi:hypothetical protein
VVADDQITILAKIKFKKYRAGTIEVDPVPGWQLRRMTDAALKPRYQVEDRLVNLSGYGACSVVSIPSETGGPRSYALALINETAVDHLRAEVKRLRAKLDAIQAVLEQE